MTKIRCATQALFFITICSVLIASNTAEGLCAAQSTSAPGATTVRMIDLTRAVIVAPANLTKQEAKAVTMLVEEVERRTQIRLGQSAAFPSDASTPVIAVGNASGVKSFAGSFASQFASTTTTTTGRDANAPEGYRVRVVTERAAPAVFVVGNDSRGVMFGVGHLLRKMEMMRGSIKLTSALDVTTSPKYDLRGHQLGFRPKTNSYDGWTLAMWEQYIRDLIVFGTNAIELIPPRSDDAADSPHFPLSQIETMIGMSRICDEYGIDVWIWYPALDEDYSKPETVEFALREWGEVFKQLPRVDNILVPGGDPGRTPPKLLMALLEKQAANLRKYHPKAGMWVAPQSFTKERMDEFISIMRTEPAWLAGIVYGPEIRMPITEMRKLIPAKYPIRLYPDITHTRHSQYPVPDWDWAFAITLGREPINPRPANQASIFRNVQPHARLGFIAYSEGCNDDVNKIVWSTLGWNPEANVADALRDYSRYFINPPFAEGFAQGLLALERNWQGPLLTNGSVYTTLAQFQAMEREATPQDLLKWRFQQALYRAYYDAYTRARLIHETAAEDRALMHLRRAGEAGAQVAISEAEKCLDAAIIDRAASAWRARITELGEALYQSIRMQLNVERYKAIAVPRGANLNTLDYPLNNRLWLKGRFNEIRTLNSEAERQTAIDGIVNRTNPGPGGFYDDLGDITRQPHLVPGTGFAGDPAFLDSSLVSFGNHPDGPDSPRQDMNVPQLVGMGVQPVGPTSFWSVAQAHYDTPLRMRYTELDQAAQYKIRVVYAGDRRQAQMRLVADERFEIHPLIAKEYKPVEFDLPVEATADGELNLSWTTDPGSGGSGRGCQVAEVWLMRKQ